MPQSPFDLLKQLPMRNVPQIRGGSPTPQEEENRDLRAQAIQDTDANPFRKVGRGLVDFVTSAVAGDPFAEGVEKQSWGSKGGMLLSAAPMLPKRPKLPIIAPEAYSDVKAGGLKLYSRLTDTFAKAPSKMKPAKAISLAQAGASKEEINLRKLGEFLKMQPATPAPKPGTKRLYRMERPTPSDETFEDILANTGGTPEEVQQIIDTRGRWFGDDYDYVKENYGGWDARNNPVYVDVPSNIELENVMTNQELFETAIPHEYMDKVRPYRHEPTPRDPMTDIPREEIMDHLASNPLELEVVGKGEGGFGGAAKQAQDALHKFQHDLDTKYGSGWQGPSSQGFHPSDVNAPIVSPEEWYQFTKLQQEADDLRDMISPSEAQYSFLQTPGPSENYGESLIKLPTAKSKQLSDIGKQQADYMAIHNPTDDGYYDREIVPGHRQNAFMHDTNEVRQELGKEVFTSSHFSDDPNTLVWSRHNDRYLNPETPYGPARDVAGPSQGKGRFIEEIQSDWHQQGREVGYEGDPNPVYKNGEEVSRYARVPDAPFKDTYHELALKQQLLDAANDPSLEWLGVADADTVSAMEGHTSVRPGTELYYNEKHPSALEKLLNPLGGDVELGNLPNQRVKAFDVDNTAFSPVKSGLSGVVDAGGPLTRVVDFPGELGIHNSTSAKDHMSRYGWRSPDKQIPGPGMWKANLPPELKQLIRERGFPAMAAFLALQQSLKPQEEQ